MEKLLGDKKMLQVSFIMICIIHNMSVLLKITRISKKILGSIIDFYFIFKKSNYFFSQHIRMKSSRREKNKNREEKT